MYAAKKLEGSGDEGIKRFTTKTLMAAIPKARGSRAPFGCSVLKKTDRENAVSGLEGKMAAAAVAVASASAAAAASEAKHAALASPAAKHAAVAAVAEKDAEEAAAAAKQAEEEAAAAAKQAQEDDVDYETDSDDEYESQMSALEYIMTYKELPQFEIDLLLEQPAKRIPFEDTELFKTLSANLSVTQEEIDAATAEHEDNMHTRVRFREWVRKEYEEKGYVVVGEEYIARRIEVEAFTNKLWAELSAQSDDDDSEEEQEEGEEIAE